MRLSNLIAVAAFAVGAPAGAQVCPYEDLMPELSRFVAATADLAPPARAEAFVERFASKHPDFYSETMFGSRDKLRDRAQRLFDPQRAPKFQGARERSRSMTCWRPAAPSPPTKSAGSSTRR
ncbi:MAG TPA: hypothetical protein VJQ52_05655 [Steroidobacteraceae bacterium]|nr:hypothetical protein [Steroidobacteraceae bacterium]